MSDEEIKNELIPVRVVRDFLHKLSSVPFAVEEGIKTIEDPKGDRELALSIQTKALEHYHFLVGEFRTQSLKENPLMKSREIALMGLMAMAPTITHAETTPVKRVALFLKASGNAFYDGIIHGAKQEGKKQKYEVTLFFGKNEDDWQGEVDFLKREADHFDGFIVDPIRSDAFHDVLTMLKEKKKPVVIVDSPLEGNSESIISTISSDNFLGGKLAAIFLAKELKRSRQDPRCIAHFSGNPKAKGHQDRNAGFLTTLKTKLPEVSIQTYQGLSSFDQAKRIALENLSAIEKCDAVFAGSDTMILGVLAAFEEKRLRPPLFMIGYDAILEAQRAMLDGRLTASVEQFPSQMGIRAVKALASFYQNEAVEKEQLVPPQLSMRKLEVETFSEKDLDTIPSEPKAKTKG